MDLWAPVKDSNKYGARDKKNVSFIRCIDFLHTMMIEIKSFAYA